MDGRSTSRWSVGRHLTLAAFVSLATVMAANAALAGQCPADKRGVDVTKPSNAAAKDVTDKVLASIDLAKEKVALADHHLRIRQLEIKPGGIVPWHSHGDRPALIYIIKGEIYEYASDCAVPILHKAGEVAPETSATAHWWKNAGSETVVLISADLLHDQNDHNM
ncbi:MAG TPA: cupin domain-containing protein [Stellaceae bacterium]|nr:cupin domain-containing protein [Stellaceae bacterium]